MRYEWKPTQGDDRYHYVVDLTKQLLGFRCEILYAIKNFPGMSQLQQGAVFHVSNDGFREALDGGFLTHIADPNDVLKEIL